jgi:hypothetical protein
MSNARFDMRGALFMLVLLFAAAQANACGCDSPETADDPQVRENADIIFVGDVVDQAIAKHNGIEIARARFKVVSQSKGSPAEFAVVEVRHRATSCDLVKANFKVGERYLISGFEIGPSGSNAAETTGFYDGDRRFYNNFCSLRKRVTVRVHQ